MNYKMNTKSRKVIINIIVIAVFAVTFILTTYPFFKGYLPYGHDLKIHLRRIAGLAEGISDGAFPVKMQQHWWNNYGYPISVMYGDVFLYIPAVLYLAGIPLWKSYVAYIALVNVATIVISYICFYKISGKKILSVIIMFLYMMSTWRLIDVLTRQAVGEYSAYMFLPLITLGLYKIFVNDKADDEKKFLSRSNLFIALCLITGFTGLVQTHLLSLMMSAFFTVIICILGIVALLRNKARKLILLIGTALFTVVLNFGTLIPMMDYMMNVPMQITSEEASSIQSYGIEIDNLTVDIDNTNLLMGMQEKGVPVNEEMPQTVGMALIITIVILMAGLFAGIAGRKFRFDRIYSGIVAFILTVLSMYMATCYFPYDYIQENIPFLYGIIGKVQYPVRYLEIATVSICVGLAIVFGADAIKYPKPDKSINNKEIVSKRMFAIDCAVYTVMFILCILSASEGVRYMNRYLAEQEWQVNVVDVSELGIYNEDRLYILEGTDMERVEYSNVLPEDESISVGNYGFEGDEFLAELSAADANAEGTTTVTVPVFAYKGYVAWSDGAKFDIQTGDNNKIAVIIPKNFTGTLSVKFVKPWYWVLSEIISALSIIVVIVCAVRLLVTSKVRSE